MYRRVGRDNQYGMTLLELLFLDFTREVILLILKEFLFLPEMFLKDFDQPNIAKIENPYQTHPY